MAKMWMIKEKKKIEIDKEQHRVVLKWRTMIMCQITQLLDWWTTTIYTKEITHTNHNKNVNVPIYNGLYVIEKNQCTLKNFIE